MSQIGESLDRKAPALEATKLLQINRGRIFQKNNQDSDELQNRP